MKQTQESHRRFSFGYSLLIQFILVPPFFVFQLNTDEYVAHIEGLSLKSLTKPYLAFGS